ncbi:MBL fold metallo-hydrolase [Stenotrophomonas sp.]|uniref:MBL fold metallo-hydrolase n=1 Tax=Stenotrophomonas sp. TaxID=69392 RepID=UPI0028AC4488|nr:MBL fold metallo-hydrolase [Stenotrophomonas sp.]
MKRRSARILILLTVLTAMSIGLLTCTAHPAAAYDQSPQYGQGRFHNPASMRSNGVVRTLGVLWRFLFDKPADATPLAPIPVQRLTRQALLAAPNDSLWRLGHSTMLLKLDGHFWLTDPVFSERVSPFSFMGPKRFHAPPLSIDELPEITGVIISHDHYDHLDHDAVLALAPKVQHFVTALGVGDRLLAWGVPQEKITQLDWWQETRVQGLKVAATPAQHFSGRSLSDGNRTLWASWVIDTGSTRIFFSGDSGYFDGFAKIGERYGPFDLAMVETGAYDADWPDVHMQPEQSLQAHLDVRGKVMMPIHNGTFDLALHPWTEPFERITALAAEQGVVLTAPKMGERLDIREPAPSTQWWREGQPVRE